MHLNDIQRQYINCQSMSSAKGSKSEASKRKEEEKAPQLSSKKELEHLPMQSSEKKSSVVGQKIHPQSIRHKSPNSNPPRPMPLPSDKISFWHESSNFSQRTINGSEKDRQQLELAKGDFHKKAFERQKEQVKPYLRRFIRQLQDLLFEEEKIIKSLNQVKNRKSYWKKNCFFLFEKEKTEEITPILKRFDQCFYKVNQISGNLQYSENSSIIEEKKIIEVQQRRIKELENQKERMIQGYQQKIRKLERGNEELFEIHQRQQEKWMKDNASLRKRIEELETEKKHLEFNRPQKADKNAQFYKQKLQKSEETVTFLKNYLFHTLQVAQQHSKDYEKRFGK